MSPTRLSFCIKESVVSIHISCIMLLGWALLMGRLRETSLMLGVLATHEMAHYIVMRGYGLRPHRVELLPFGARIHLERLSERPDAEAPIAVAGPLNNFMLLGVGLLLTSTGICGGYWWDFFLVVNLVLALFNLVPALPLDGGCMFRSYLAETVGMAEATRITSQWGIIFGITLNVIAGYLALRYSMFLWVFVVLGGVMIISAYEEKISAPAAALGNLYNRRVGRGSKNTPPPVEHVSAYATETVTSISRRLGNYGFAVVWILDKDLNLLGTLTEEELRQAVNKGRADYSLRRLLECK